MDQRDTISRVALIGRVRWFKELFLFLLFHMKSFYFPHDDNAAGDERILKLRAKFGNAEGYGMWWMLLEHLVRNQGYLMGDAMGVLSISYGLENNKVAEFIEFCVAIGLLEKNKRGLFNARLMEHIDLMEKKSEGGKEGAKRRWGSQKKPIRSPISSPNGSPNAEDRIGEDRREEDMKPTTGGEKNEKTGDLIRDEILKWLGKSEDIKSPEGWVRSLSKFKRKAIEKAWKEAKSRPGLESPGAVYERIKYWDKNI